MQDFRQFDLVASVMHKTHSFQQYLPGKRNTTNPLSRDSPVNLMPRTGPWKAKADKPEPSCKSVMFYRHAIARAMEMISGSSERAAMPNHTSPSPLAPLMQRRFIIETGSGRTVRYVRINGICRSDRSAVRH